MRKLLPTSLSTLILILFFLWGMTPAALGQCADPQNPYAGIISGTTAELHWTPGGNCANPNMTTIEYGLSGFVPGTGTTVMVACPVSFPVTLAGLTQSVAYDFYVQENCGGAGISTQVGPATFISGCSSPAQTYQTTFDGQANCATTCGATCNISGLFSNSGTANFDWLLNAGGTPTAGTGPTEDVTYQLTGGLTSGEYLYIESSNVACQFPNSAELVSSCIDVTASGGSSCHLSFYYHMFGPDIGTLDLNISTNNGTSFTNIWRQNGAVGNQWRKQYIDLTAYNGQTVLLQFFVSRTSGGGSGDIAIDQIEFYGSVAYVYVYYADTDTDTYGDPNVAVTTCTAIPPAGMVADNTDCNDNDPAINPGQAEVTCNGIDENCNGNADDATTLSPPNAVGTFCIASGSNAVPSGSANSGGNLFWFDALTGGTQIASGTAPSIGPITSDTIFYLQEATSGFGLGASSSPLLITEASTDYSGSSADMVEIQNFSGTTMNYTGWRVFLSNSYSDINNTNSLSWNLGTMAPGQADFRTDDASAGVNYWGNNIFWNPGAALPGWVLIMDNTNTIRDAVFWGWAAADIAGMNVNLGGTVITGANVGWTGDGLTINTTCSATASNEAMQRTGNQDNDNDTDWGCAVYQPGAQNPGLVTVSCTSPLVPVNVFLEDADDAYHSSECSAPSNDGVECAACTPVTSAGNYIANTTCSPSTGTMLNTISGCPGIDLNDNPAFMAITANQAGQMDIIVSNPGGIGISTVRAALVGPISCPTTIAAISSMAAIDCDQHASALTLTHPNVQAGQVFMLIVNSVGTGPIPINLNGSVFAIELGSITATEVGNTSLVEWNTLTEEFHAIFEVERSDDGQHFKQIGTVKGSGNSTSVVNYEFVDELPLSGMNYYRLRSVDVDGGFSYSRVVTTYFEFEEFSATVFPNPFNNTLTLDIEADRNSKAHIQLVDMTGRTVFKQGITFKSGLNQIEIDPGQQLVAGSYLFVLNYRGKVKTFKVFKEN